MKKKILSVALLLLVILVGSNSAQAQVFTPKYLNISTNNTSLIFNAGEKVDLKVSLGSSNLPRDKAKIEYGIVREIKEGNVIQYEPISVSVVENIYTNSSIQDVKMEIPNSLNINSTSTYVFYARTYVTDDVDQENFLVSRQSFRIKGNNALPLTKIKYIDLLNSNGKRYSLTHGPSIYDLSKTKYKGVASSTSLEITFESNVDTTINPTIVFSKLRSDSKLDDFSPSSIVIKKGLNDVLIPLPVFNYEAGVYQGVLKLGNGIPDVAFQYIVSGEMVTFGQPKYNVDNNSKSLVFNIYGAPVDLDLDIKLNNLSTSTIDKMLSASALVYNTEFVLKDVKGREVYRTSESIDFSTSTHSLLIPSGVHNFAIVDIKTFNTDGKVIYEGTKDLNLPSDRDTTWTVVVLVILLLLALVSVIFIKNNYFRIIVLILAMALLFFGFRVVTADVWSVPDTFITSQNFTGDAEYYKYLTILHEGALIRFNTNIQTEAYDYNQNLNLVYNASFEVCNNTRNSLVTGLFLYHDGKLKASGGQNTMNGALEWYNGGNYISAPSYQHGNHTYTSRWIGVDLGNPEPGDTVVATYQIYNGKDANITYSIPLLNVTDKTVTESCVDGKVRQVTTIGKSPYTVVTVSDILTDTSCSDNVIDKATSTIDYVNNNVTVGGDYCGVSEVSVDQGLNSGSTNLCVSGFSSQNFTTSPSVTLMSPTVWSWKCEGVSKSSSCSAVCKSGLQYCSDTNTCSAVCSNGDACPSVAGIQTVNDPIYLSSCTAPKITADLKLNKPYANEITSKCSIRWSTNSNIDSKYTSCKLDGNDVSGNSSDYSVSVGTHTLTCIAKVVGEETTLSSDPVSAKLNCSRVPQSTEN